MNSRLAEALNLLNIGAVALSDGITISPKDHAKALFSYMHLGNYLSKINITNAANYLAAAKPFAVDSQIVIADLMAAVAAAIAKDKFDADIFIAKFASESYFTVNDVIDLLTFIQQTAFDRKFGVERDCLPRKPWIEEKGNELYQLAKNLDVIAPHKPNRNHYHAIAIMGGASSRVTKRVDYFSSLELSYDFVWALSGNRELSKGLDDETIMRNVAEFVGAPVNFVEKKVGDSEASRVYLDGVTETMMVNYLINKERATKISVVDSVAAEQHWRANTTQSAVDIVKLFLTKLKNQEITNTQDGHYHVFIIAEQPYPARMAKQVQREFDKEIKRAQLQGKIVVEVEGCGPGLLEKDVGYDELSRVDSELGALMAERFHDARSAQSNCEFRDASLIMFSKRDKKFKDLQDNLEHKLETPQMR
jgi:hypothetical protein